VSVGKPLGGTAMINGGQQIVYAPSNGFLGDDTFSYKMSDGLNTSSATVQVSVYFYDGLIWFPFDQTSGLTTLDAGGDYAGSLMGYNYDPSEWVAGKWNQAIQFNGSNYLAINGFSGILGNAPRTVAAWVKTSSADQQPVIAWGPNNNGNKWTFMENGHARIEITSGFLEGTHLVNDGQWHHIACSYSNNVTSITNAKLYVDGVVETSFTTNKSLAVNSTSSGNATIGSDVPSGQNRYFVGVIDEPQIYNTALTAAQIVALVHATNQSAAAWYHRYYGDATLNWTALDSAGHPRLLDYAMGVEPWTSTASELAIQCAVVTNYLQVQFPRRVAGTSELIYLLQSSTDLTHWFPWNVTELAASPLAEPGVEEAMFESPVSQTNATFIRLNVSLP